MEGDLLSASPSLPPCLPTPGPAPQCLPNFHVSIPTGTALTQMHHLPPGLGPLPGPSVPRPYPPCPQNSPEMQTQLRPQSPASPLPPSPAPLHPSPSSTTRRKQPTVWDLTLPGPPGSRDLMCSPPSQAHGCPASLRSPHGGPSSRKWPFSPQAPCHICPPVLRAHLSLCAGCLAYSRCSVSACDV